MNTSHQGMYGRYASITMAVDFTQEASPRTRFGVRLTKNLFFLIFYVKVKANSKSARVTLQLNFAPSGRNFAISPLGVDGFSQQLC